MFKRKIAGVIKDIFKKEDQVCPVCHKPHKMKPCEHCARTAAKVEGPYE